MTKSLFNHIKNAYYNVFDEYVGRFMFGEKKFDYIKMGKRLSVSVTDMNNFAQQK